MDYPKLPGLTPDGRVYWNEEMGTIEARIPNGGYRSGHGPALLELPNGDLLCVWFAGSFEGNADVHIVCSRLEKDSEAWTEPVDVSGDPERSEQNPSLFYGPDGAAWCMYTAQLDRQAGKDNMQFTAVVRCQKSTDGGRTWGPYETVFPEEGTFCRQPIQILSNGRWIFSNWLCTDSAEGLSGDPHRLPHLRRPGEDLAHGHDAGEPRPCPRQRGWSWSPATWWPSCATGRLTASTAASPSTTARPGASPSPPPCPTTTPASAPSSSRAAGWPSPTTPPAPRSQPGKAAWPGLRCPVAVALSEDGGLTFPIIRWMERGEGYIGDENKTNNKQYEYPYLMQTKDGMIHLAYAAWTRDAMKYVRFTEEDVLGEKRERVGLYNPTAAQGCK